MKNKTTLTLIELTIMVLVFSAATALCLKAFAWSQGRSVSDAETMRAALCCQNAAETVRGCRGDLAAAAECGGGEWDGESWSIRYDDDWQETAGESARYELRAVREECAVCGGARVSVACAGEELFALSVRWQEELP